MVQQPPQSERVPPASSDEDHARPIEDSYEPGPDDFAGPHDDVDQPFHDDGPDGLRAVEFSSDRGVRAHLWFFVRNRWRRSVWNGLSHDRAATIWRRVNVWLGWTLAILAAASGFSFLSDQSTTTGTVLAVLTALLAATNAALSPGERAGHHSTTAAEYARIERQCDMLMLVDLVDRETTSDTLSIDELRKRVEVLDSDLTAASESAPPVSKWRRHDPASKKYRGPTHDRDNRYKPKELA